MYLKFNSNNIDNNCNTAFYENIRWQALARFKAPKEP